MHGVISHETGIVISPVVGTSYLAVSNTQTRGSLESGLEAVVESGSRRRALPLASAGTRVRFRVMPVGRQFSKFGG